MSIMDIDPNPPGLLKREVIREDGDYVVVRETWDLTAPGCPMIVINLTDFTRRTDLPEVGRDVMLRRDEWERFRDGQSSPR